MDDVDAAEALQAKNMLVSGDWITQHLNGTIYIDKAPLKYWLTASLYELLGVHDWVARLPTVIAVILLCWLVVRIGRWADSPITGLYSGLVLATSIGLFLFTRTIIPDVILTLFITVSLWCLIRLLECVAPSLFWALGMHASIACAVLTKGLIGLVFPVGIGVVYLLAIGRFTRADTWRRLYLVPGTLLFLAIAAPWHILAALHNPPVFDLHLHVGPDFGGKFRGFIWFYFINEQALRFLNERWPRDYDTVPRLLFWLYHLLWFFPWILFLPALPRLADNPAEPSVRFRRLLLSWIASVMIFFTFSTTQEYYSMPIYPALALLLGLCISRAGNWATVATKATGTTCVALAALLLIILVKAWSLPTPGDIYAALIQHPNLYTLSLGHMADLTIPAFAYLRLPLAIAFAALLSGGVAALFLSGKRAYLAIAFMLAAFFQAARLALVVFDPYLSSFAIADRLNHLPAGLLVVCGKYNPLSSVFFYATDHGLQNEPDLDILEYGSLAPGAPKISLSDSELKRLWTSQRRIYIVAKAPKMLHLDDLLDHPQRNIIFKSGDKYLLSNLESK